MMEENMQQNMEKLPEEKKLTENFKPKCKLYFTIFIIISVLVVVILIGLWYWFQKNVVPSSIEAPIVIPVEKKTPEKEDSTSVINEELENIDIADLEKEFQEIDQDLNSL